jgi:Kef-type K+ transport system membrane component KefB
VTGTLLLQDIVAISLIAFLMAGDVADVKAVVTELLSLIGLVAISILLSLFSLSILSVFIIISYAASIPVQLTSFIAGIAFFSSIYSHEIASVLKPLRNFFAIILFTSLGMELNPNVLYANIVTVAFLLFIAFVLKSSIVYSVERAVGCGRRRAAHTSLYLSNLSEFSIIVVSQALLVKRVSEVFTALSLAQFSYQCLFPRSQSP